MKLPFGIGKPMETPIKKLIPEETKRELTQLVGTDELARESKDRGSFTTREELLGYLNEARTIQEIMGRFNYKTLSSTYAVLYPHLKASRIINLGHGLYVSASAGVKTFNVGDLDERELQERGLAAFKQRQQESASTRLVSSDYSLKERKEAVIDYLSEPHTIAEIQAYFSYGSPGTVRNLMNRYEVDGKVGEMPRKKRNRKSGSMAIEYVSLTSKYASQVISKPQRSAFKKTTNYHRNSAMNEIPAWLTVPRSATEVQHKFGYRSIRAARHSLDNLVVRGEVVKLTSDRTGLVTFVAPGNEERVATELPAPIIVNRQETVTKPTQTIEELAMRYVWEMDLITTANYGEKIQTIKNFVTWANNQETAE